MAKSRAGTPAATSFAMASSRRSGRGARGSIRLRSWAFIDASEILTMRSLRPAISVRSSTSLAMPADFVVMPTRSPGTRAIASSTRRVTSNRASAG